MLTRRRFLEGSACAGLGLLVPVRARRGATGARPSHADPSARDRVPTGLLDPARQPRWINPLPNPLAHAFAFVPDSTSGGVDRYDIGVRQFRQPLGLVAASGAPMDTTVWGYATASQAATYPGRTIHARTGRPVLVRWRNELRDGGRDLPHLLPIDPTVHWALADTGHHGNADMLAEGPVPIVTHLHGGHTRSDSDGLPDAWFTPGFHMTGPRWNEWYTYDNDQPGATLWYHDHALGITRLNVYAGLAGFYLLRDEVEQDLIAAGALPSGPYEVAAVIQDRMFTADGELHYPSSPETPDHPEPSVLPEFFGNVILVNGKAWPRLDVEPRPYRVRLLNGSDSRFYVLFLSNGEAMWQIGTDSGLLPAPVPLQQLTLAPGERADLVIDFSRDAGRTIIMRNTGRSPYPKGEPPERSVAEILAFRVTLPLGDTPPAQLPSTLRTPIAPLVASGAARRLVLFEAVDEFGRLQPMLGTAEGGVMAWSDPITERVHLGDTEMWEVFNATMDAHPIHLHLVSFQVASRQRYRATIDPETGALSEIRVVGRARPPDPNERGWKDTARMLPGEVTRIVARFDRALPHPVP
jgi:spore coat protein A